jgi:hypothetical protein
MVKIKGNLLIFEDDYNGYVNEYKNLIDKGKIKKIKILFDFGDYINKIPNGVTHLIINCNQSSSLTNLPNSLTQLKNIFKKIFFKGK